MGQDVAVPASSQGKVAQKGDAYKDNAFSPAVTAQWLSLSPVSFRQSA